MDHCIRFRTSAARSQYIDKYRAADGHPTERSCPSWTPALAAIGRDVSLEVRRLSDGFYLHVNVSFVELDRFPVAAKTITIQKSKIRLPRVGASWLRGRAWLSYIRSS
jgi:hypothetical protein